MQIKGRPERKSVATDIDEFDAISGDGVERRGRVLEHLMLVDGFGDFAQLLLLQHLDERDELDTVAEVRAQIVHLVSRFFEDVVDPVAKRVRLNFHPDILIAFDGHACGCVTLGAACHQTAVRNVQSSIVIHGRHSRHFFLLLLLLLLLLLFFHTLHSAPTNKQQQPV